MLCQSDLVSLMSNTAVLMIAAVTRLRICDSYLHPFFLHRPTHNSESIHPFSFELAMANSKYEYVKSYESPDSLLPSTYIVVRIDGRGFHRYACPHPYNPINSLPIRANLLHLDYHRNMRSRNRMTSELFIS